MHPTVRVVALLAALLGVASTAQAQYPQRRDGVWIGFGLGYGSSNVACNNCDSGVRIGGVSGFLKVGGSPSRNVLIGGAVNGWSHSDAGFTETMANVTASIYLYPAIRSGLFLTGGLGVSGYHANTFPSSDGTGWGFTAGAGYDIRVGRDVSLTPVVNFVYGALEDFDVPATGGGIARARNWRQNVVEFGLGVTFH
jgi:outer membrane protein with beta-barrel domain